MSKTAAELKVGDFLVFHVGYGRGTPNLVRIDRETKTQWIAGGHRFRKENLLHVGGSNYCSDAHIPTESEMQTMRTVMRTRLAQGLLRVAVVTAENLERVEAFLRAEGMLKDG